MLSVVFVTATCFGIFLIILKTWFRRKLSYWKSLGVKQWTTKSPFGNYGDMVKMRCNELDIIDRAYAELDGAEYGGMYYFWKPLLLLRGPELAKKLFVKDFEYFADHYQVFPYEGTDSIMRSLFFMDGEVWKANRTAFSHMFTPMRLKEMLEVVKSNCIEKMLDRLEKYSSSSLDFQVDKIVDKFTINSVTSSFIGFELHPGTKLLEVTKLYTHPRPWLVLKAKLYQLLPFVYKLFGLKTLNTNLFDYYSSFTKDVMKAKEEQGGLGSDLISFMVRCKNGENKDIKYMSDEDAAAHLFNFLTAGNDTTSLTLSLTLFELSRNRSIQRKLVEEIDRVTKEEGSEITYDFLRKLTYMDQVLQEIMRLYPAVGMVTRICNRDYKVDSNLTLPKGTHIIIPIRAIHHDEKYFPSPYSFNPERFSAGTPWAWMPFGKGPRQCIGMRFAEMEIKVALASILRRFVLLASNKMKIPLTFDPKTLVITNKPVEGVWIKVRRKVMSDHIDENLLYY